MADDEARAEPESRAPGPAAFVGADALRAALAPEPVGAGFLEALAEEAVLLPPAPVERLVAAERPEEREDGFMPANIALVGSLSQRLGTNHANQPAAVLAPGNGWVLAVLAMLSFACAWLRAAPVPAFGRRCPPLRPAACRWQVGARGMVKASSLTKGIGMWDGPA